jgi:hypothetical protein
MTSLSQFEKTVEERLSEAFKVLKTLKSELPRGYKTNWPPIVQTTYECYEGYDKKHKISYPPEAISRMDETLLWLYKVNDVESRKLLWLRSTGMAWRKLESIFEKSHTTLRKYYKETLQELCHFIDKK